MMDELKGVILSYYLDKGVYQENKNNREKYPYLSWSPYDRIQIKQIDCFSQFFQAQFQTRWTGVAQQMHLIYDFPEICLWKYHNEGVNTHCLIETEGKEPFGLCCVIAVRFTKYVKNNVDFRNVIYQNLMKTLKKKYGEQASGILDWTAFYSLGAEDVVFIVLADAIDIFQVFIDILCKIQIKGNVDCTLVSSLSSFVNVNDRKWKGNPKADLIVRLTLKSSAKECVDRVLHGLQENGISKENIQRLLLGKCILDVRIPASDKIMEYYKGKQGIFNGSSDYYEKNISFSRSYWVIDIQNDIDSFEIRSNIDISPDELENKLQFKQIKEDSSNYLEEYPLAQFVLKEYKRMIVSENSASWRRILEKQYDVVKVYIFDYIKHNQVEKLYLLLKQVQNVLLHIRQSTTPVAEVPYHNYTYAGSYHDILKMYYGIISSLLSIGYQMEHDEETLQYEIVYCVDFESTSKLHSDMYILSDIRYDKRFVVFHLPFEAFIDIETTVKLLIHEVFHYIAPFSRKKRNRRLLEIWSVSVFNRMLKVLYDDYQVSNEVVEKIVSDMENSCDQVNEKIYLEAKKIMAGFDDFILNDFIRENGKVFRAFRLLAKRVFSYYYDEIFRISKETFLFIYSKVTGKRLEESEHENLKLHKVVYSDFNRRFENDTFYSYISMEMSRFALASKEAFCDLNMIKLFGMNVNDYLYTFYKLLFGKYKNLDGTIFNIEDELELGCLERRLGMIIDIFYEGIGAKDSYKKFSEEVQKSAAAYKNEAAYKSFTEYCIKCYSVYLESSRMIRKKYLQLLGDTNVYWESVNQEDVIDIRDIHKILKIGNSIKRNLDAVVLFIDKDIMGSRPERMKSFTRRISRYESFQRKGKAYGMNTVASLGEYIEEVCRISNYMKHGSKDIYQSCWYRGVCSSGYSLLPGLQRSFDDEAEKKIKMSPYAYQTKIIKDAYFMTMSTPALWTEQLHGIAEHTCCLQHYGMPTNLLDFSLDMLVALHFALNPDAPKDKAAIDMGKYVPKVVIFNPVKYNKAVCSLREGYIVEEKRYAQFSPVMFNSSCSEMEEYFVQDMSADFCVKSTEKFFDDYYVPSNRVNKYPKPVIIWQSNSRVQAQNGIFMAYNLHAGRTLGKEPFSYLDLKEIQSSFLCLFSDTTKIQSEKFLEEIYIEPLAIEKIRNELLTMGINMPKMYPELSKIFEYYTYAGQ